MDQIQLTEEQQRKLSDVLATSVIPEQLRVDLPTTLVGVLTKCDKWFEHVYRDEIRQRAASAH
jgi:hypothetical protein